MFTFKDKLQALTSSRRFWAAVGGVVVVALQDAVGLDADTANRIVALLAAWILGDSITKTS